MLLRRVKINISSHVSMSSDDAPSHCLVNHQHKQPELLNITTDTYPSEPISSSHRATFQDYNISLSMVVELNRHNSFERTDKVEIGDKVDDISNHRKRKSSEPGTPKVEGNKNNAEQKARRDCGKDRTVNDVTKDGCSDKNNAEQNKECQPEELHFQCNENNVDSKEPGISEKDKNEVEEAKWKAVMGSDRKHNPEKSKPCESGTPKVEGSDNNADEKALLDCGKDTNDIRITKDDCNNKNNAGKNKQCPPVSPQAKGIDNNADSKEHGDSRKEKNKAGETKLIAAKDSVEKANLDKNKPRELATLKVENNENNADEKARSGCEKDMNDNDIMKDGCNNKNKPELIKKRQIGASKVECLDNGVDPKEPSHGGNHINNDEIKEDRGITKENLEQTNHCQAKTSNVEKSEDRTVHNLFILNFGNNYVFIE